MPTTIAVAPGRSTSQARRMVAGEPTASKAWSTPPGIAASTAAAGSGVRAASTVTVAPRRVASSSLAGSRSTATICPAPTSRAAATICSPIPPQPTTHTVSPARTPAVLRTAPTPVTTPQPSSDASHSGSSGGSGTADAAGTTQCVAKHDTKLKCCSGRPSASASRELPSRSVPAHACAAAVSHRLKRPAAQARHARQHGTKQNATRSPFATPETPAPTASTTPAPSWPGTIGRRPGPELAVGQPGVGVADAGGGDAHEHLALPRRLELDGLHRQRHPRLVQDRRGDAHQMVDSAAAPPGARGVVESTI